jgi:hypothetical protein
MAMQQTRLSCLPRRFIVRVDQDTYEEVQSELLQLGYRWRLCAPPGKGTSSSRSDCRIRRAPHVAINCYVHLNGKPYMARVIRENRVESIARNENCDVLTSEEFLYQVRKTRGSFPPPPHMSMATIKDFFATNPPIHFGIDPVTIQTGTIEMRKKRTVKRIWSFESRHAGDIDFVKILEDLSYTKPIALVRPSRAKADDEVWLVVHYKLHLKARLIDQQRGLDPDIRRQVRELLSIDVGGYPVRSNLGYVKRMPLKDTSEVVRAARLVKGLPWPDDEDKAVRTIEVSTPEV